MTMIVIEGTPSSPWWQDWLPLFGSVVVAVATLIGVYYTARNARDTFVNERAETRRDRQRTVIADLVIATQSHAAMAQMSAIAMAVMTEKDLVEYANTDSVERQGKLRADQDRALLHAQVEIRNPELRAKVDALAAAIKPATAPDNGEIINQKKTRDERLKAGGRLVARLDLVHAAANALRDEAIRLLPVDLEHEQREPSGWKKWIGWPWFSKAKNKETRTAGD